MRSLMVILAVFLLSSSALAQPPLEAYAAAHKAYLAHAPYAMAHDDSPDALTSLTKVWAALADLVAQKLQENSSISSSELAYDLCVATFEPPPKEAIQTTAEEDCDRHGLGGNLAVARLTPELVLVSPSFNETGTVFLLGKRDGKFSVIWSVSDAPRQSHDPHGYISAWKLENEGGRCWKHQSKDDYGTCGPLFASVTALPKDGFGHPRFAIDAEYAQGAGATVLKQTSIWTWTGSASELQWVEAYPYMIDQAEGTSLDEYDGILKIGQKSEFKTVYSCGSCTGRPVEHSIMLTKTGVADLGTRSLSPEADLVDEFLWRANKHIPAAGFASPHVASAVRRLEMDPWTMGGFSTRRVPNGAIVCMESDNVNGSLAFTLRHTQDGGYFITSVRKATDSDCPNAAFDATLIH